MAQKTNLSHTRARLLTTAAASVVLLSLGSQASAQAASADLNILDSNYTLSVNATAMTVDQVQRSTATFVQAVAGADSGSITLGAGSVLVGPVVIANTLEAAGVTVLDGSYSVTSNAISATAYANIADNTISSQTTPAFADSSAIGNAQVNGSSVVEATSADASILAIVQATNASGGVRTLTGTVAVDGNAISTSANGNVATNTIEIADSVSVSGTLSGANIALDTADRYGLSSGGVTDSTTTADLVIANGQVNDNGVNGITIGALTRNATIQADIQAVNGGSVVLSDNAITSAARGNRVTSTVVTGDNAADIDTTIALSNLQENDTTTVAARTDGSQIRIDAGFGSGGFVSGSIAVDDSTIAIDRARIASTAYANEATQTLSLSANAINGTEDGLARIAEASPTIGSAELGVAGQLTIGNVQLQTDSNTSAVVENSRIAINLYEDGVSVLSGNTVRIAGQASNNIASIDAEAVGNRAVSQAVSLDGNTVGTGVAVASLQDVDSTSSVSASVLGSALASINVSNGDVGSSNLTIENTLTRALAISNSAATGITVNANNVDLRDAVGDLNINLYDSAIPTVEAAYATLSQQRTDGDVSATVNTIDAYRIFVADSVSGSSTLSVVDNGILGAALGNDTRNTITLAVNGLATNGLGTVGSAPVAAAVTKQTVDPNVNITAQAFDSGAVFSVYDSLSASSSVLATDRNSVEALAIGNRTTANSVTISANSLATAYDGFASGAVIGAEPALDWNGAGGNYTASNLALGSQYVDGATITATLTNDTASPFSPAFSTEIETVVAGSVNASMLSADNNRLKATVIGNSGVNGVNVTAGTNVTSSTGVANLQVVDNSTLTASIGVEGSEGTAGTPAVPGTVDSLNGTVSLISGTSYLWTYNASGLTPEQRTAFLSTYAAQSASYDPGTGNITMTVTLDPAPITGTQSYGYTYGGSPEVPGTPAVDPAGGVFVRTFGDIFDSTLSVAGNTTAGSVTGNSATNTLTVDANFIGRSASGSVAEADNNAFAIADNMLLNMQEVSGSTIASTVFGAFAIDTDTDQTMSRSTLTVSDNTQTSTATANTATSSLMLDATTMSSTAGLMNEQNVSGAVSASSNLWLYAPVGVNGSTVTIADNENRATATANIATNTVALSGTNLVISGSNDANIDFSTDVFAVGAMYSDQSADGSVSATAETRVFNEHMLDTSGVTVQSSSVAFDGNATIAEATANRVTNRITLDATNVELDAGLANEQVNAASVQAQATASVTIEQNASTALNGSTLSVAGNSTRAIATGNAATNSLALNAANVTGGVSGSSANLGTSFGGGVTATFAVLNDQANYGPVTAASVGVTYGVGLNDLVTAGTALNGSMTTVSGNSVLSQAAGNVANNSLTVVALAADNASYAIGNVQQNYASISASVTSATIGSSAIGGVTSSSAAVAGNSIGAVAIGNSVTNALTR